MAVLKTKVSILNRHARCTSTQTCHAWNVPTTLTMC